MKIDIISIESPRFENLMDNLGLTGTVGSGEFRALFSDLKSLYHEPLLNDYPKVLHTIAHLRLMVKGFNSSPHIHSKLSIDVTHHGMSGYGFIEVTLKGLRGKEVNQYLLTVIKYYKP